MEVDKGALEGLLNCIFRILVIAQDSERGMINLRSMALLQLSESVVAPRLCLRHKRAFIGCHAFSIAGPSIFWCTPLGIHCLFLSHRSMR